MPTIASPRGGPSVVSGRGCGGPPGGARSGARRPSGRPGARWLRVVREPLSTERPGPTRVAPRPGSGAGGTPRPDRPAAPRDAHAAPGSQRWCAGAAHHPAIQRRSAATGRPCSAGRTSVVDPAEPTGRSPLPVNTRLTCGHRGNHQVSDEDPQVAPDRPASRAATGAPPCHSFGRTNTVCPETTVRRHTGRAAPGVRSGSPGVPERGSVDQRATRSSGAWTTSSPVRHTA